MEEYNENVYTSESAFPAGSAYRVLLWAEKINREISDMIYSIKYFELSNQIEVVGIVTEEAFYNVVFGYKVISKNKLNNSICDYLIILGRNPEMQKVQNNALALGFSYDKIIPFTVMTLDGFSIEKYTKLRKNPPTIIAINCWGGGNL